MLIFKYQYLFFTHALFSIYLFSLFFAYLKTPRPLTQTEFWVSVESGCHENDNLTTVSTLLYKVYTITLSRFTIFSPVTFNIYSPIFFFLWKQFKLVTQSQISVKLNLIKSCTMVLSHFKWNKFHSPLSSSPCTS